MKKLPALLICVLLVAGTPSDAVQCRPNPVRGCLFIDERSPEDIFLFVFRRRVSGGLNGFSHPEAIRQFCHHRDFAPPKSKKKNPHSRRFYKQVTPDGVTSFNVQNSAEVDDAKHSVESQGRRELNARTLGLLYAASVIMDPSSQIAEPITLASANEAPKIFNHIPKPSQKFSTWKKMNPVWWFGNADDPEPPPGYRRGKCCRKFMWYMRNPFHNFDHYVIGIGDKHFTRVGRYPDRVANPNGGWNWAVCRYRILRLPFVDYQRGKFEFYLGWRNGGNFGAKLNFAQKRAASKKQTKTDS